MIRIWQAYACNNSVSFRVVARFADAAAAAEVTAELAAFFAAQAEPRTRRTRALTTLARTYGFDFIDNGMSLPGVLAEGEVMVAYHPVSLGMGPGIGAFVEDRGGVAEPETRRDLGISVLARLDALEPQHADTLVAAITSLGVADVRAQPPWAGALPSGPVTWFRDPGLLGLHLSIRPIDVATFKTWLVGLGIEAPLIRLEDPGDQALFAALAAAHCTACGRKLAYLDPRLHDIETPQLVCTPCGGLYDLATFYQP